MRTDKHQAITRDEAARAAAEIVFRTLTPDLLSKAGDTAIAARELPRKVGDLTARALAHATEPLAVNDHASWKAKVENQQTLLLAADKKREELEKIGLHEIGSTDQLQLLNTSFNTALSNAKSLVEHLADTDDKRVKVMTALIPELQVLVALTDPSTFCGVRDARKECIEVAKLLKTGSVPNDVDQRWASIVSLLTKTSESWPSALLASVPTNGEAVFALIKRVSDGAKELSSLTAPKPTRSERAFEATVLVALASLCAAFGSRWLRGPALTTTLGLVAIVAGIKFQRKSFAALALPVMVAVVGTVAGYVGPSHPANVVGPTTTTTVVTTTLALPSTTTITPAVTTTLLPAPSTARPKTLREVCGGDVLDSLLPGLSKPAWKEAVSAAENVWRDRGADALGCPKFYEQSSDGKVVIVWFELGLSAPAGIDTRSAIVIDLLKPYAPRIVWQGYADELERLKKIGILPSRIDKRVLTADGHYAIFWHSDSCNFLLKADGQSLVEALPADVSATLFDVATELDGVIVGLHVRVRDAFWEFEIERSSRQHVTVLIKRTRAELDVLVGTKPGKSLLKCSNETVDLYRQLVEDQIRRG